MQLEYCNKQSNSNWHLFPKDNEPYRYDPIFEGCFYFEKGVSVVYYGEEIGMLDADISYENTMDPWGCNCGPINYVNCSRDPARTPMQWNGAKNAGFSQVRFIQSY